MIVIKSNSLYFTKIIKKNKLIFCLICVVFICSCQPSYQKIEGKWAFVSYDEGAGKNVQYFDADVTTFEIFEDSRSQIEVLI